MKKIYLLVSLLVLLGNVGFCQTILTGKDYSNGYIIIRQKDALAGPPFDFKVNGRSSVFTSRYNGCILDYSFLGNLFENSNDFENVYSSLFSSSVLDNETAISDNILACYHLGQYTSMETTGYYYYNSWEQKGQYNCIVECFPKMPRIEDDGVEYISELVNYKLKLDDVLYYYFVKWQYRICGTSQWIDCRNGDNKNLLFNQNSIEGENKSDVFFNNKFEIRYIDLVTGNSCPEYRASEPYTLPSIIPKYKVPHQAIEVNHPCGSNDYGSIVTPNNLEIVEVVNGNYKLLQENKLEPGKHIVKFRLPESILNYSQQVSLDEAESYEVTINRKLEILSQDVTLPKCLNDKGSVTVNFRGGSGRINVELVSNGNVIASQNRVAPINKDSVFVFSGIAHGSYTVKLSDDSKKASGEQCFISTPAFEIAKIEPFTTNSSVNQSPCYGGSSSVTIGIAGGTPPFSYKWDNSSYVAIPSNSFTVNNISFKDGKTFNYTILDNNGCESPIFSVSSTDPSPVTFAVKSITGQYSTLQDGTIQVENCSSSDGSVDVLFEAVGGSGLFSFAVNGVDRSIGSPVHLLPDETAYEFTALDKNGCQLKYSKRIKVLPRLATQVIGKANSCAGNDGRIDIKPLGGSGSYTFSLPNVVKNDLSGAYYYGGLPSGVYNISVNDGYCTASENGIVLNPPVTFSAVSSLDCTKDYSDISVANLAGGNGSYSYTLAKGGVNERVGALSAGDAVISNLASGIYNLSVTSDGCSKDVSGIQVYSRPKIARFDITNPICPGGSARLDYEVKEGVNPNLSYSFTYKNALGQDAVQNGSLLGLSGSKSDFSVSGKVKIKVDECGISSEEKTITLPYLTVSDVKYGTWSCSTTNGIAAKGVITADVSTSFTSYSVFLIRMSGGAETTDIVEQKSISGKSSYSFDVVDGGIFKIKVVSTDSGCSAEVLTGSYYPQSYLKIKSVSVTDPACFGKMGTVKVEVENLGSRSLNVEGTADIVGNTATFKNLAGSSTYKLNDGFCYLETSLVELKNPEKPTFKFTIDNPPCYGDNAAVKLYDISPSGSYAYIVGGKAFETPAFSIPIASSSTNISLKIVGKDGGQCESDEQLHVVTMPDKLEPLFSTVPVRCNGEATGVISLSAKGGTPPYSYADGAKTLFGISYGGLTAGAYSIKAIDSHGCSVEKSLVVAEPSILTFTALPSMPTCRNGKDGVISIKSIDGGNVGSYTYSLNSAPFVALPVSGVIPQEASGTSNSVTIKDSKGCIATQSGIEVGNPPLWSWDISTIDPSCSSNGEIRINSITGGYGGYKYYESGSAGASILSPKTGVAEGTYRVEVADSKLCVQGKDVTLHANKLKVIASVRNITCFEGSDGEIKVEAEGGRPLATGGYRYVLSKDGVTFVGELSGDRKGIVYKQLKAGSYTLGVYDSEDSGCSYVEVVTLAQHSVPVKFNKQIVDASTCKELGLVTFKDVTGYQGSYSKLLFEVGAFSQTGNPSFSVKTGSYTLRVTDEMGCSSEEKVVVAPEIITASLSVDQMDCYGNNNGAVTINQLAGGLGKLSVICLPYGAPEPADGDYTSKLSYSGLGPGRYVVYGRDENNRCKMVVDDFEIKSIDPLKLTYQPVTPTCNGYSDGAVNIQIAGGNGGYVLSGFGKSLPVNEEVSKRAGFLRVDGVSAGSYAISLTDKNGCQNLGDKVVDMEQPEPITLALEKLEDVDCKGNGNGRIYLSAKGGNGSYSYSTYKNGSLLKTDTNQSDSYLADNLLPALYTFDVTDRKGCALVKGVGDVKLNEPDLFTLAVSSFSNVACHNVSTGTIAVKASGGNYGAIKYSLNGLVQESPLFDKLPAGKHRIAAVDTKGCAAQVEQLITQPEPLAVESFNEQNPLCYGDNGSIAPTLKGGTAPYLVQVEGHGSYSSPAKLLLPDGSYKLWYKDANGCEFSTPFKLVQPEKLLLSDAIAAPLCTGYDGKITLDASGGTPSYTFKVGNSDYLTSRVFAVKKGSYGIEVKDAHGCSASRTVDVSEPTPLSLESAYTNPLCNGLKGSISLKAAGGTAPYQYTHIFAGAFPSNGSQPANAGDMVLFTNLLPNKPYTPAVMDANGCTKEALPITLIQPDELVWTTSEVTDLKCAGDASGAVKLGVKGGTTPYSYSLNGAVSTDGRYSNLSGGLFGARVLDKNGCELQKSITVKEPTPLVVSTSVDPQRCFTLCDGRIVVSPTGGTLPYTISWNDRSLNGSSLLTNLCGGSYLLNVRDGNGCEVNRDLSFAMPEQILISLGFKDTTLCKGQTIKVVPAPQRWGLIWMRDGKFLANGASYVVSTAGSYVAKALDSKGCSVDFPFGVKYVDDSMVSDFLISSKVAATDTVAIVDISSPKPDKIVWSFDKGARVIEQKDSYLYLAFDEPGTYVVGLKSYTGSCATSVEKRIEVGPKKDKFDIEKSLGYRESILKSFKLYPNPTAGNFKVKIVLNKVADVNLQLLSASSGVVLDTRKVAGSDSYEVEYNKQELKQGFYIINMVVEGQSFSLKLVKI